MKLYEKIYQIVKSWFQSEPTVITEVFEDVSFENPLNAKIYSLITLDLIDLEGIQFKINSIEENLVQANGEDFYLVDYNISAIGNSDFQDLKLRVIKDEESKTLNDFRALLMYKHDDFAYDEGFLQVVNDESKELHLSDDLDDENPDNDIHEQFWRCNDVGVPYFAKTRLFKDKNKDQNLSLNEVSNGSKEFWDFSRMTKTEENDEEFQEFVYVEMDKSNGWFSIWRGTEVVPHKVAVF